MENFYAKNNSNYPQIPQFKYPEAIIKEETIKSTKKDDRSLDEILEIIKNSINNESEDEALYLMMKNQAMQEEDKEILESIANDEKKHNLILKQVYLSLTGKNFEQTKSDFEIKENTYIENLKKSLFGELGAIKKYRKVLNNMENRENFNKIFEIMTDEIIHANKYNYLITKNLINKIESKNTK